MQKFLYKLLRLAKFLTIRIRRNITISTPAHADIAILDEASHESLLSLFPGKDYAVIGNPGGTFCVNARVVKKFLKWFFVTDHPAVAYSIALIECINPKIVITLIDNSDLFYEVSRFCKGPRFLAIQNANRIDTLSLPSDIARKIHIPEFACFGEYEKLLYTEKGATVGKFYPVGSLHNALYWEHLNARPVEIEFDLCVVSEPMPNADNVYFPGTEKSVVLVLEHAIRFCEKHNLRLCIAGKRPDSPQFEIEVNWYAKHLGRSVTINRPVRYEHSTAKLIDKSAVSIAQCSTALRMAMGRGKRVLFCNYSNFKDWDFPIEGLWFSKDPEFSHFETRLLTLLAMTDLDFQAIASDAAKHVMPFDKFFPTTNFLRGLITDAISEQPSTS